MTRAAVLTVSDGVHAGIRDDTSGDTLEALLRDEGFDVVRRVVPDDAGDDCRLDYRPGGLRSVAHTDNGWNGVRTARRDARGDAVGYRPRSARRRRGNSRRRDRSNAARASLSRGRGSARGHPRREPARVPRGLPGRVRGHSTCSSARARARGRRNGDRARADVTVATIPLPRRLASLVRIEHTVFALPFAYVGAFLSVDGWPGLANMVWVTVAMVGARTLAMSLNRLVDAELDARNPRTALARAAVGRTLAHAGARALRRVTRGLPSRGVAARSGRPLALAHPGRDVRHLPVPQAGHVALPRLAGRVPRRSRRSVHGSP